MAEGNLVKSEQISKLINAVQDYARDLSASGAMLQQAANLCKQEMEGDDLSVYYASYMEQKLQELVRTVYPKLEKLVEDLFEEKKRVDDVTQVNG